MKQPKLLLGFVVAFTLTAASSAFAQVKIGTNPTVIGTNSNLEVEAADANKVIVNKNNGTVIIENTPSGAITDSIMTVDANGNVRAINANKLRQLLGASGSAIMTRNASQTLAPAVVTLVGLNTMVLDQENGVNVATSTFTVKRAGVYTLNGITNTAIPAYSPLQFANIDIFIQKIPAGSTTAINLGRNQVSSYTGSSISNTLTLLDNAVVGDRYRLAIQVCGNCIPGNPNYTLNSASFYVFKNL
jgi:hypothetical protein